VVGRLAPRGRRARAASRRRSGATSHANLLSVRHQGEASIDGLRAALTLYRKANDHAGISEILSSLAVAAGVFADDLTGARRDVEEACRHARIANDDGLLGVVLGRLAAVAGGERRAILEQAVRLLIPSGNYREIAAAYSSAAYVARTEERLSEATSLLDTALQAAARIEDPWETMIIFGNIGLAGLSAYLAAARTRYGATAWHVAEQAGAALPYEQPIAYALDQSSRPTPATDAPTGTWDGSEKWDGFAQLPEVDMRKGGSR
jgi:hypothetical protein